jgi:hypothetical protein
VHASWYSQQRLSLIAVHIAPRQGNYIPMMIIALAASLVFGRHLLSLIYM